MKGKIDILGMLHILRKNEWGGAYCPYRTSITAAISQFGSGRQHIEGEGPAACGTWCPHFREPQAGEERYQYVGEPVEISREEFNTGKYGNECIDHSKGNLVMARRMERVPTLYRLKICGGTELIFDELIDEREEMEDDE